MKLRLLEHLRCPACRGLFELEDARLDRVSREHTGKRIFVCGDRCPYPTITGQPRDCDACLNYEVMAGRLVCTGCERQFHIIEGIPRLLTSDRALTDRSTAQTSTRFGYLWSESAADDGQVPSSYHFDTMAKALGLPPPTGLVLDAGCGEGIDLTNQTRGNDVEVIGVELSDGGCRTSFARTARLRFAHVIQADLRQLPFDGATFDHVYSYGVLHHVASPPAAAAELARVIRPGADISVYLYEDFSERSRLWRVALRAVNMARSVTTRIPPRLLYRVSVAASPLVFVMLTLPHRALKAVPWTRTFASNLPYRHGQGAFSLAGDLYDRFSAPVEFRYSRRGAEDLLSNAGFRVTRIAYERGWMVLARAENSTS